MSVVFSEGFTTLGVLETFKPNSPALTIKITNNQGVEVPAGLQIPINLSKEVPLSNIHNLIFYTNNGNKVYAWLESSSVMWLKLPFSIPAGGSTTLYASLLNAPAYPYTGINPVLAKQMGLLYGQYDNGANVFNFYDNFAGTSLNTSKWGTNGNPSIIVNNGLTLGGPSNSYIGSVSTFSSGIFDAYMKETSTSTSLDYSQMVQYSYSTNDGLLVRASGFDGVNTGTYWVATNNTFTEITSFSITIPTQTNMFIQSVAYTSATTLLALINYNTVASKSGTSNAYTSGGIGFRIGTTGAQIFVQWVRVRAYPPNGVMPSVEVIA